MLQMKFGCDRPLVLEIFIFENIDTQTDSQTHRRRLDWYTISSPCKPAAKVSKMTYLQLIYLGLFFHPCTNGFNYCVYASAYLVKSVNFGVFNISILRRYMQLRMLMKEFYAVKCFFLRSYKYTEMRYACIQTAAYIQCFSCIVIIEIIH